MDVQKPIKKQIVEDNKADKPYEKLNTTKDDICKQKNLAEESDSEDEALLSRIGNVPIEWYKNEEHIGYDIYGNPIKQYDQGDTIDAFLRRTDDPNAMYVCCRNIAMYIYIYIYFSIIHHTGEQYSIP